MQNVFEKLSTKAFQKHLAIALFVAIEKIQSPFEK
jgi:hypothetical protein